MWVRVRPKQAKIVLNPIIKGKNDDGKVFISSDQCELSLRSSSSSNWLIICCFLFPDPDLFQGHDYDGDDHDDAVADVQDGDTDDGFTHQLPTLHTGDLNPASLSCHELSPVSLPTNCPMQCHTASPHDFLKSFVVFSCPSTDEWPQSLHLVLTLTLLSLHCRILPRPGAKIARKFMPGTCSAAIWCPQPIHNTDKVKGRSKEKSLYFGAAIVSWHNNRYKCLINKLIN